MTTRASSVASATPSADRLIRLTARVAAVDAEHALAEACVLTGTGCRQGDPVDEYVEIDVWVPEGGGIDATSLGGVLLAAGIDAEVSAVRESSAWRDALRDFHQPVVAGRVRVRPPWVAAAAGMLDVVIDPGMAFGTGQHPTTRTSLEMLAQVPPGAMLDAGTGSGVLAVAAARLGFGPIVAIDADPLAVTAARACARANMVAIDVREARIGVDPLPRAPVVIANLTLEVLLVLAVALEAHPPDHLVASGLRVHEAAAAAQAFRHIGLTEAGRIEEGGWATVRLVG